jgi:serine/threonine-protein kinase
VLGSAFPQLEILGLIGQGGMGVVYRVRQKSLDRVVALKLVRPGREQDPAFAERFGREARALARLPQLGDGNDGNGPKAGVLDLKVATTRRCLSGS